MQTDAEQCDVTVHGEKKIEGYKSRERNTPAEVEAESSSASCVVYVGIITLWKNICTRLEAARLLFGFDFRTIILNYLQSIFRQAASRACEGTSASFASASVRSCCFLRLVMSHFCHLTNPQKHERPHQIFTSLGSGRFFFFVFWPTNSKKGFPPPVVRKESPGFLGASKQFHNILHGHHSGRLRVFFVEHRWQFCPKFSVLPLLLLRWSRREKYCRWFGVSITLISHWENICGFSQ